MAEVSFFELRWMNLFAKNLDYAIAKSGLSRAEVARRTGLSTGTITRYLKAERSPKAYHVRRIAEVLGVRTDELLDIPTEF